MTPERFHDRPFDEGTLTKLQIFELYTREWLPVFLAPPIPTFSSIHLFDFFSGPGTDSVGELGSPLRLLRQLREYQDLPGRARVQVYVHFFDADPSLIGRLRNKLSEPGVTPSGVEVEAEAWDFQSALAKRRMILESRDAAKLVLIDQYGVDHVTDNVFRKLTSWPSCDFLFFIASAALHRFREHPAVKQKIDRPDDYYHVHRKVYDYYRTLLNSSSEYYLGRFSIKKGSNVYGLIFGSGHPLGLDKFLEVAWKSDQITGEANFDIDRDDFGPLSSLFDVSPTKVAAFERDLEEALKGGRLSNERDVMLVCFDHGVRRKHAEPVLVRLQRDGVIKCGFRVPDVKRHKTPRSIQMPPRS